MVIGLKRFRDAFANHRDQFTLIGGAAASEWFSQAGLTFRATKDASSLSAILMDPDYYRVVMDYREVVEGLPLLLPAGLIVLKARAWLDLSARRERKEPVKMDDIKKHRNDVFRLSFLLAADSRFAVPRRVLDDLGRFLDSHPPTADVWHEVGQALAPIARIDEPDEVLQLMRQAFVAG